MTDKYIEEYVWMNEKEREEYINKRRKELCKVQVEDLTNMIIELETDEEQSGGRSLYEYKKVKVKLIDKLNRTNKSELIRIILDFESGNYTYRVDLKKRNIDVNDRFEELNKMNVTDLINIVMEHNMYHDIIEE